MILNQNLFIVVFITKMKMKCFLFVIFLSLTLNEKIKFSKLIKNNDSLKKQSNNLKKDELILNDENIKIKLETNVIDTSKRSGDKVVNTNIAIEAGEITKRLRRMQTPTEGGDATTTTAADPT